MKIIKLILLSIIFSSCATKKKAVTVDSKDILLELKSEKSAYKSNRWTNLHITIKNNSNEDITILNPMTEYGYQLDFFKVKYKCELPSIIQAPYPPTIKKTELDIITIKAKSNLDLILKGNLYEVICNSPRITQVKITYDTKKELSDWIVNKIDSKQINLLNKLTKLKIESKEKIIE